MNYRNLGKSDLLLSEIAFGAWAAGGWMWGQTNVNDAIHAMQAGIANGMTTIDTAPVYGKGLSEEIVGKAIANQPRDRIQILTKFGMRWDLNKGSFGFDSSDNSGNPISIYKYAGKESVIYECEQSLKRLKTDYIDLYQIHWPDASTPIAETFEAVNQLIKEGKIRYAGVSNFNSSQMQEALEVCPIISNQVPFSMINRTIQEDVVPFCESHEIGILAYSPMERGLLTGKIKNSNHFDEGDHRLKHPHFQPEFINNTHKFLQQIKPIADKKNCTLAQLVLAWTIFQPNITIALAGARNDQQALSNLKASNVKLYHEEVLFIDRLIATYFG